MPRKPATLNPRVACYARVSGEDQAERQTVDAQRDFLRRYVELHSLDCHDVYVDDGVSGTIPLTDRPEGRRLLDDARAGHFGSVIVYRLDRLGRNLRALLNAHDQLDTADVAIRSATEPFDTATAIGQFLFQLLGSLAELERSTIVERMTMGRDRAARLGRTTGGRVAFGYDVTAGQIVPSTRVLPHGENEADCAAGIFARVAGGATLHTECSRLEGLGVPSISRWPGKPDKQAAHWYPSRLHAMLRNPIYRGERIVKSKHGTVISPVEPLVSAEIWRAVQSAMTSHRDYARRGDEHVYLLRGLVRCRSVLDDGQPCGMRYTGGPGSRPLPDGTRRLYYHCLRTRSLRGLDPARPRCYGQSIQTADIEALIWADVRDVVYHPGPRLVEAEVALRATQPAAVDADQRRDEIAQQLAKRQAERGRAQRLYREGLASLDETERVIRGLDAAIRADSDLLAGLDAEQEATAATVAYLSETEAMLTALVPLVVDGDDGDQAARRRVLDLLVREIELTTALSPATGRQKRPQKALRLVIGYRFSLRRPS